MKAARAPRRHGHASAHGDSVRTQKADTSDYLQFLQIQRGKSATCCECRDGLNSAVPAVLSRSAASPASTPTAAGSHHGLCQWGGGGAREEVLLGQRLRLHHRGDVRCALSRLRAEETAIPRCQGAAGVSDFPRGRDPGSLVLRRRQGDRLVKRGNISAKDPSSEIRSIFQTAQSGAFFFEERVFSSADSMGRSVLAVTRWKWRLPARSSAVSRVPETERFSVSASSCDLVQQQNFGLLPPAATSISLALKNSSNRVVAVGHALDGVRKAASAAGGAQTVHGNAFVKQRDLIPHRARHPMERLLHIAEQAAACPPSEISAADAPSIRTSPAEAAERPISSLKHGAPRARAPRDPPRLDLRDPKAQTVSHHVLVIAEGHVSELHLRRALRPFDCGARLLHRRRLVLRG